jgi:hypothetical protein
MAEEEALDRVRAQTPDKVTRRIDEARLQSVEQLVGASPTAITQRIRQLDREWDVERILEANSATLSIVGSVLGALVSRRWLLLSTIVPAFLLQHALQSWCPPLAVIRRMGVRTRKEIDIEKIALKALRGDFGPVPTVEGGRTAVARAALTAAAKEQ